MSHFDPLSQLENDPLLAFDTFQAETKTHTKKSSFWKRAYEMTRFMVTYFAVTGVVFVVLLFLMNFSAYSALISNWINPAVLSRAQSQIEGILDSSSVAVNAASAADDQTDTLANLTEKLKNSDPTLVYERKYTPDNLLSGIQDSKKPATFSITPYENRIVIPRIGKNIPLVDVELADGLHFDNVQDIFMDELKKGVVRYPGTAKPGEVGNAFIFGHSSNYPWVKSDYNDSFALIDDLEWGDSVIVYYGQKKYTYRVVDRALVYPGDISALEQRDKTKRELSLMTCWPLGTALKRLIIFAELTDVQ